MQTTYENYLRQWVQVCDTVMNFEEEEKTDQEDDSICAWYEIMEGMEG
jgi:hypothetical protein